MSLTQRQFDCLAAIDRLTVGGVCPSYEELRIDLGAASKNRIWCLVRILVERGCVRKRSACARSITITPVGRALLAETRVNGLRHLSDIDLYAHKAEVIAECDRRLDRRTNARIAGGRAEHAVLAG